MHELIRVMDVLPQHYCRYLIEKFERSRPEQTAGAAVDAGWNKADRMTGWRELNLSANPERWEREIATFTTAVAHCRLRPSVAMEKIAATVMKKSR